MKQKFTILILAYLIFTMLTGAVHAQENYRYKGYIFIDNIDQEIKSEMHDIIDKIINKEIQLYILEDQAQNLQTKADKLKADGNNQEAGEIYMQLNIFYKNNIYPLRWEIEDLTNTDDDLFVRYIKDIDERIKQEEILKGVKKLEADGNKAVDPSVKINKENRKYIIDNIEYINFTNAKDIPLEAFTDKVVEGYKKISKFQERIDSILETIEPEDFYSNKEIKSYLSQTEQIRQTELKEFMDTYNNTDYKIWKIDDIVSYLVTLQ